MAGVKSEITEFTAPPKKAQGVKVLALIRIKNLLPWDWVFNAELSYFSGGSWQYLYVPFLSLKPGEIGNWLFAFTMPSHNVELWAWSYWWDYDIQVWKADDVVGGLTVWLDTPTVGYFKKPAVLEGVLLSGFLNLHAGDWVTILGIKIPPFSFTPGEAVEGAIDWVINGLNWIHERLAPIIADLASALGTAWSAFVKIDDWIFGAAAWFTNSVSDWWTGVWNPIQSWINNAINRMDFAIGGFQAFITTQISWVQEQIPSWDSIRTTLWDILGSWTPFIGLFNQVQSIAGWVFAVQDDIIDFFSDPFGYIEARISDWLNEKVA